MYLKNINAFGFKSFADKTNIDMEKGITCIVGPNGSGKSNIVDAIRWVLGEQSIKSLRGNNSMTDVIFTGSKSRVSQNRAVVALTFNNSDHYLNSDFDEIEVKRAVYTTGENEYYLNGTKVRLKEITDLFIDSGASKASFNIISQGSIADIINSKPEERRIIFEEAAGVLKYKKRKEESIKKLEKTKDNLDKAELLINELKTTIEPLAKQSQMATRYLEIKNSMENIEIALIVEDITRINTEFHKNEELLANINADLEKISHTNVNEVSTIEKLKLVNIKIEDQINQLNSSLIAINDEVADLNTRKQINIERQKYEYDDNLLENNLIKLKEQELQIKNNIANYDIDISQLNNEISNEQKALTIIEDNLLIDKIQFDKLNEAANNLSREKNNLKNIIELKTKNIEEDSLVPFAVKNIINNPRLPGICGYLAKLITIDEQYTLALETSLGANASVVVVENENNAQKAIDFLRENKLGRATFFPLNIIQARSIDYDTLKTIEKEPGYINILSNLVSCEAKYKSIILNQVGNVILVEDMNAMNKIGRLINYKYRIVTLDGDIQYSGGAITGGANKKSNSVINQRFELEKMAKELALLETKEQANLLDFKKISEKISLNKVEEERLTKKIINLSEKLQQKQILRSEIVAKNQEVLNEIKGTKGVKDKVLDNDVNQILNDYYQKIGEKQKIEKELSFAKQKRQETTNEINSLEQNYHTFNISNNRLLNEQKNLEVSIAKMEVKLDELLLELNEVYSITYEKAQINYHLDIDINLARLTVNKYKSEIRSLGEVNLGAISEYERLNKRYTFLTEQRNDLNEAINSLKDIISEMDDIMQNKFIVAFNQISEQFKITFKKLFKGGVGIIKLTAPDNLLETGVEIIAEPPGKKLNSIALLSNGEKTLTAIALLFAILQTKPTPFCVLDEVEAALDEANVGTFGNYLNEYKEQNQFIIITHKKKTMEFADRLYGITMQESGVSKLVTVKLEN